jgi:hypothetical protein
VLSVAKRRGGGEGRCWWRLLPAAMEEEGDLGGAAVGGDWRGAGRGDWEEPHTRGLGRGG